MSLDSIELSNRVSDSFDGTAPMIRTGNAGHVHAGVDIHAIVLRTLELLRDEGYLDLESVDEPEAGAAP